MMMDGKNFRTIECNCWSSEQRIKECNATDVDVQVSVHQQLVGSFICSLSYS